MSTQPGETDADGFHRAVNVFFRMGCRDKARFVRGRREIDALFQHVPKEGFEEFFGSFLRGFQIIDFLFREEEAEHGARTVEGVISAVFLFSESLFFGHYRTLQLSEVKVSES